MRTSKTLARYFATAVKFSNLGNPKSVLSVESYKLDEALKSNDILVKILAAPIHPSDINYIEGTYGVKPELPAFAGNEGVGIVTKIGDNVKSCKVGDWVIPAISCSGTWRTELVGNEKDWINIPNDIPWHYASCLSVNPGTALRLLKDFVDLKKGDWIIQNGANSMVGLAIVQFAREFGFKTINVIRQDRPHATESMRLLANLGGDINVTDEYLGSSGFNEILAELPPIRLAINSVGGNSVSDFARVLSNEGTIVSYGGMAKKSLKIPSELIAYKQIKLKGFWFHEWNLNSTLDKRREMLNEIVSAIREKKLSFFFESHDFDDFNYAFNQSQEPFRLRKTILYMDHPDRLKEHDARCDEDYTVFDAPAY